MKNYDKIENRTLQMFRDYLINRLYLQRINLKRPLSKGSRFKIYFRLENWENRGSRQNFHKILFFKDRVLINLDHYVTLQIYYDHIFIKKLSNLNLSMDVKTQLQKLANSYQKYDLRQRLLLVSDFLFCYFSVNLNKQNKLMNNK